MSAHHHNDRALGLLAPEPGPQRWRALLGRGKAAVQQRHIDAARDDLLTVLTEAKAAGELRPQAEALTLLGGAEVAVGAYDAAGLGGRARWEFWQHKAGVETFAEALMVDAASTLTVVAVGMVKLSSLALCI